MKTKQQVQDDLDALELTLALAEKRQAEDPDAEIDGMAVGAYIHRAEYEIAELRSELDAGQS